MHKKTNIGWVDDLDDLYVWMGEPSIRLWNVTVRAGARIPKDFCSMSVYDWLRTKGCGKRTLGEIRDILKARGV